MTAGFKPQHISTPPNPQDLKTTRRYVRLETGLAAFTLPEKTPAAKERARLANMKTEELRNAIRRLAGLPLKL